MLDISMPDLAGHEVLARIRSFEGARNISESRRAVVVMVTSHADRENIVSCLQQGCNDYIVKPFSLETIRDKMSRLKFRDDAAAGKKKSTGTPIKIDDLIREVTEQFERDEIALPSSPRLTMAFRQMILDGAGFKEISDLLRGDAAVATELIRTSNSALYRGVEENRTVEQAIARLGTGVTEQIVAAICHRALFVQNQKSNTNLLKQLWRHSLATAHACDLIAEAAAPDIREEAFTMGLLHDVGWLLLIQALSELELKKRFQGAMSNAARIAMLEAHHGDFGARIFEKWGFDEKYQQISRFHHHPDRAEAPSNELLAVHLANRVAVAAGFGLNENSDAGSMENTDTASHLGLSPETLERIRTQVEERMAALEGIQV